jgi:DNA-directed RNA polymerase subunit E'
MFYKVEIKDHIRVPAMYFGEAREEAVAKSIRQKFEGRIDQQIGIVVDIADVSSIGEGKIIPGDGASYFETVFSAIAFRPELQEVVMGQIKDITDFGAFITMGPIEGMIHISQTMDDFVSFSKEKVLMGRDSKKVLKVGDVCRARCVAVSFKDVTNPKIGLTMRQAGLGKLEWLTADEEAKK